MNHKWQDNKCIRCGIIRAEVKSVDDKDFGVSMYQYSNGDGNWVVYRPDCYTPCLGKHTPVIEKHARPFSIKNIIENEKEGTWTKREIVEDVKYNKQDYSELLMHPKWQRKRLEIMQRDDFKCQLCKDEETTLNIHHKEYKNGNKPWEYENDNFITLCKDCHLVLSKTNFDFDSISFCKKLKAIEPDKFIHSLKINNDVYFVETKQGIVINQFFIGIDSLKEISNG